MSENPLKLARLMRTMSVRKIVDYTPQIRELFLECEDPKDFNFKAGQFVTLHVPQFDAFGNSTKAAMRAYSVASSDQNPHAFRLIFKYVETGIASQYIWNLNGGEKLTFTGPFGRVLFKEPPTEQIVFLNTGSGISQHFSFLESNLGKFPDLRYRLLFGVRKETDIYYRNELERIQSVLKNFEFEYVLSRPSDSWRGRVGYVQDHIHQYDYLKHPTTFYLCGNGAMIKDVKSKLESEGFDKARVLSEAFD